jgi:hypothetical protein
MFFFSLFTPCGARISELVIVLSQSVWKIRKMRALCDFGRGHVGAYLAGTYVTKTAALPSVSTAIVSEVMSAYTNLGRQHQRRGTVGENQHWHKEIFVHWEGLFRKSQNCRITGDRTAELNIHLEGPLSAKTVICECHKSNIHCRAAILEPLIPPWPVVRKRTIPTELPPLVGEVSANFSGWRVSRDPRNGSTRPLISVF